MFSSGSGDGQVVSMVFFYSDDPSSNPAEATFFLQKSVLEKNEINKKRPGFCKKAL